MTAGAILRGLLGMVCAFVAVWIAVVLYWRASDTSPTAGHLVVYLLGLPLLLIGGLVLARWAVRRARARRTPVPAALAGDIPVSVDEAPLADRVLHLLASAVHMRAGSSGEALAQALAQPERPGLHPVLRDRLGLPVFAAAVEGVDPTSIQAQLRALAPGRGGRDRDPGEAPLRALALLDPVAEELLHAALPALPGSMAQAAEDGGLHPHAMHHSRSARAIPAPAAAPLRVSLLVPAGWPEATRRTCARWLQDKAGAVGFAAGQVVVDVVPLGAAAEVWQLLDQLAQGAGESRAAGFHLLLAAQSLVTAAAIDRLDAQHDLLVSSHPEGLIPGEGAAGVLVSVEPARRDLAVPAPLRLHRLVQGQAGRGRAAGRQSAALMRRALDVAAQPLETVAMVFSDADHRPSRAIEIAIAIAETLPELEPVEHARSLGLACGETGVVAPLALLAAATAHVAADQRPVLVVGLADRDARFALVVSPLPSPAEDDRTEVMAGRAGATPTRDSSAAAAATA